MGQRTGVIVQSTRAFCKRFRSDCLQSSQATSSMSEPTTDSIMLGYMSDEKTCQANSLVVRKIDAPGRSSVTRYAEASCHERETFF